MWVSHARRLWAKDVVKSSWNVMAHGDAREGKWGGNWGMDWVISTLHTTSEHGVSSIITADAHTSAASSQQNWLHRRCKWIRPFRRKTKSSVCACAMTFRTQSTVYSRRNSPPFRGNVLPSSSGNTLTQPTVAWHETKQHRIKLWQRSPTHVYLITELCVLTSTHLHYHKAYTATVYMTFS